MSPATVAMLHKEKSVTLTWACRSPGCKGEAVEKVTAMRVFFLSTPIISGADHVLDMEIIYNTVKTQTLWLQHQAANSLGTLLSIVPFGWTKFSVYQNASISTIKRNHAYHKWCPQLRRNTILTLIPHQIYLSSHCAKISAREKKQSQRANEGIQPDPCKPEASADPWWADVLWQCY